MTDIQSQELAALLERLHAKGWPDYSTDPELCMERAREFLDEARRIVPDGSE